MATYTVFAQTADATLPISALRTHAERHFDLTVAVDDESPPGAFTADAVRLLVRAGDVQGSYAITVRPRTAEDVALARTAEQRGSAAGMSALAERCSHVWLVEDASASPEWLTWEFCALLAFAALGPILPEDGSTLLGVRSARARAGRLKDDSQRD